MTTRIQSVRRGVSNYLPLAALLALAAASAAWACWDGSREAASLPSVIQPASVTAQNTRNPHFQPIESIRVGQRVLGANPWRDEVENLREPDPATWRLLRLVMRHDHGDALDITLLRPLEWISGSGAAAGHTIKLSLPELGAAGCAEVLAIEACPPLQTGPGQIVTGTFAHRSDRTILDLQLEGDPEPIGVTDNHLIWSATRQAFVAAGELAVGEELSTLGGTSRIASIAVRENREQVYNLEVHSEHVYCVGATGALVHNACPWQVGRANELRRDSIGDGLHVHHAPQAHPAAQVIPGYDPRTAPAITVPEGLHDTIPRITGGYNGSARDLLATSVKQLRAIGAPNSALRDLIDLTKSFFPDSY